jgi:hypothetical protein
MQDPYDEIGNTEPICYTNVSVLEKEVDASLEFRRSESNEVQTTTPNKNRCNSFKFNGMVTIPSPNLLTPFSSSYCNSGKISQLKINSPPAMDKCVII